MEARGQVVPNGAPNLVLVIDHESGSRRELRRMLLRWGLDVVHTGSGIVGLELLQRIPDRFRLVLVDLDVPDLPGGAIVETLLHLRPGLPVLCMSAARVVAGVTAAAGCLEKPLREGVLEERIRATLLGQGIVWSGVGRIPPVTVAEARIRYAATGDLVTAAQIIAQALPIEEW